MYKFVRKLYWPRCKEYFQLVFYTGPYSLIRIKPLTLDEYLYGSSHAMEKEFAATDIDSTLFSLSDLSECTLTKYQVIN